MKTIFEIGDAKKLIHRWLIKNTPWEKDLSFASTIVYRGGFLASHDSQPYCLISALTDGMVLTFDTEEELISLLNAGEGYRLLEPKELIAIIRGVEKP